MRQVTERQIDDIFLKNFLLNDLFLAHFAALINTRIDRTHVTDILRQTPHRGKGNSGTIDIEIRSQTCVVLIENKIDARDSVTSAGASQQDRYGQSAEFYREGGLCVLTVLIAPGVYCDRRIVQGKFDKFVTYEDMLQVLSESDAIQLQRAIECATAPYEPEQNLASASFFRDFEQIVSNHFSNLILKSNPNSDGIRPTGSHTIYFNVEKTLLSHVDVIRPRFSLQCWDSTQKAASVKIMLKGGARFASRIPNHESLSDIGAYLRPAGRSLGITIDTPRLNTQMSFLRQEMKITEALRAASRLQAWWNSHPDALREWSQIILQSASET